MPALDVPRALLLDHGGVLARSTKHPERLPLIAERVHALLTGAGCHGLDAAAVLADIRAGKAAYTAWKQGNVRRPRPPEVGHRELWTEFIGPDWPTQARAAVAAEATALCTALARAQTEKTLAPGMRDVLETCTGESIRVGVVSNTLVGTINRELERDWGTGRHLAVQVYSDEVGYRKPDPFLIRLAADALGLAPADCWYVGDTYDRDVVCGRRAGVGAPVLMLPADRRDPAVRPQPDVAVADGPELLGLLHHTLDTTRKGASA